MTDYRAQCRPAGLCEPNDGFQQTPSLPLTTPNVSSWSSATAAIAAIEVASVAAIAVILRLRLARQKLPYIHTLAGDGNWAVSGLSALMIAVGQRKIT